MVRERDLKGKARVRFSMVDFFFIVETLPIIVKSLKNDIACLRKGKLRGRQIDKNERGWIRPLMPRRTYPVF